MPDFEVIPADVDEESLSDGEPGEVARLLAGVKAEKVRSLHPDALVIGSDTVVTYRDENSVWHQLAKPVDREDAVRMLGLLSGRWHSVITGIAVLYGGLREVTADTTEVQFRELSPDEIRAYVETGEPMDKAGAYAIQGGASGFVQEVRGSTSNVIGLPLEILEPLLNRAKR